MTGQTRRLIGSRYFRLTKHFTLLNSVLSTIINGAACRRPLISVASIPAQECLTIGLSGGGGSSSNSKRRSIIYRPKSYFHYRPTSILDNGSESSTSVSLSGAKVPGNESSRERKFYLWNFRSRERKYAGTKVAVTIWSVMY